MSNNEILTPAMTDWIGQRASFLILNAMVKGPDPFFDYDACVARFKQRYPDLPVLYYDWFQASTRTGRTVVPPLAGSLAQSRGWQGHWICIRRTALNPKLGEKRRGAPYDKPRKSG
ncbi:MAG: hypothetical protein NTW86_01420 [Candidatus Sumerlaeota bacterium]|nr:hypothetical protein [Candidatus Sumerlaeota bacterium]